MCLMYSTAQTNDCMGLIVTSVFVGNLQTSTESTVPYQHHLCDLGSAWCPRPLLAYLLADINQHYLHSADPEPVRKTLRPRLG